MPTPFSLVFLLLLHHLLLQSSSSENRVSSISSFIVPPHLSLMPHSTPSFSPSNRPRVLCVLFSEQMASFYLLLNLSGDSSASGSPQLSRLDEKAATLEAADLKNMGLAIHLLLLDEPPPPEYLTLDSDIGKNPLRRKKGEAFTPL
ncbi:uncharacterized protein LOC120201666 [Hibiscus syriacus]|uniref:uncharacterized protein LOC120201666 n=1 Tax=Hibiscus syriacus TaxID=106335 RepID=UPI001924D6A9|nr:uncharacterized protein LOC120201666 [Hibiscus syriacus]